jgi:hypothetical protein
LHNKALKTAASGVGFAALYVSLYQLSGLISGNEAFGGVASAFFLPAFVRLLAFLIIGYWSIPALFVAALICVDLGLGLDARIIVAAFLATGAPLGIAFVMRAIDLDLSLSNLTPGRLLWLSIGSSMGNTIFYQIGITLAGVRTHGPLDDVVTFVGDTAGTWAIIYLLKLALTVLGRTASR